jgi:hypothetical protein
VRVQQQRIREATHLDVALLGPASDPTRASSMPAIPAASLRVAVPSFEQKSRSVKRQKVAETPVLPNRPTYLIC